MNRQDRELTAPRKLTNEETTRLRSLLRSELRLPPAAKDTHGGSGSSQVSIGSDDPLAQQAEEDAADLLDYTFAMIANGKDVGYVVEELKSMEMDICDGEAAERMG
eukprot:CAMPEP_0171348322 /NCGR_PEP_ID=MMETSP0878-20121228/30509_1 /TAXON_ID=67004 /ORGANISM="Thalassiosira weissflogii, Strain CCMP1336" /LENGTH=105 /DNA_ID=CAMNT_0011852629 /DNA_START=226 /DNA_END=540 /DNA_ORIENTATION=-